jgi:uncharacterized protein (TIGR00725 family)
MVESGTLLSKQKGKVNLQGTLAEWLSAHGKRHIHADFQGVVFIICGRNVSPGRFLRCVHSITRQTPCDMPWRAVLVDDDSDVELSTFYRLVAARDQRFVLLQTQSRRKSLQNHVLCIRHLVPSKDAIIVTLDMDDALLGTGVLQHIHELIVMRGVEAAAGGMLKYSRRKVTRTPLRVNFQNPRAKNSRGGRVWSHMRCFRKYLFDLIKDKDLRDEAGSYFELATDWAYMLPIADVAYSSASLEKYCYYYQPCERINQEACSGGAYQDARANRIAQGLPPQACGISNQDGSSEGYSVAHGLASSSSKQGGGSNQEEELARPDDGQNESNSILQNEYNYSNGADHDVCAEMMANLNDSRDSANRNESRECANRNESRDCAAGREDIIATIVAKPPYSRRTFRVAVVGHAGRCIGPHDLRIAFELGVALAKEGFDIICGGEGGVMEYVCRGAKTVSKTETNTKTIGLLRGNNGVGANPYLDVMLPFGQGDARNVNIAMSCHGMVAVGGGAGTLSEISHAWNAGRLVIGFNVSGWSSLVGGKPLDGRPRQQPCVCGDRVYLVDTVHEVIGILKAKASLLMRAEACSLDMFPVPSELSF